MPRRLSRPFRAWTHLQPLPGALPWAGLSAGFWPSTAATAKSITRSTRDLAAWRGLPRLTPRSPCSRAALSGSRRRTVLAASPLRPRVLRFLNFLSTGTTDASTFLPPLEAEIGEALGCEQVLEAGGGVGVALDVQNLQLRQSGDAGEPVVTTRGRRVELQVRQIRECAERFEILVFGISYARASSCLSFGNILAMTGSAAPVTRD